MESKSYLLKETTKRGQTTQSDYPISTEYYRKGNAFYQLFRCYEWWNKKRDHPFAEPPKGWLIFRMLTIENWSYFVYLFFWFYFCASSQSWTWFKCQTKKPLGKWKLVFDYEWVFTVAKKLISRFWRWKTFMML